LIGSFKNNNVNDRTNLFPIILKDGKNKPVKKDELHTWLNDGWNKGMCKKIKKMLTEFLIKSILSEELFNYKISESIQDTQIVNYLYDNLLLERLLIGEPLKIEELRKLLRKKIVRFEFIKLNGETRPSVGTTMLKYVPPSQHPKGIRPSSPKVATFYDLDKDAWRSVSQRSKEIVLKKDEKTDKPIIIVKDRSKIKVKPVAKQRDAKDTIEQGQTYKYQTNRGTNTYVDILRELPNGEYQVSSPLFKTTFAIDQSRIGNKFKPKEEKPKEKPKEEPIKTKQPKEEPKETPIIEPKPLRTTIEKPKIDVKPVIKPITKPVTKAETKPVTKPITKPAATSKEPITIILPTEVKKTSKGNEAKTPPIDITPKASEPERPEDLSKPKK
jgi:hypothetical protein